MSAKIRPYLKPFVHTIIFSNESTKMVSENVEVENAAEKTTYNRSDEATRPMQPHPGLHKSKFNSWIAICV